MNKEIREMTGYVLFMNVGVGSRSEGFRPFLLGPDITVCKLYHIGDDELLNQSLVPYRGKYCKVQGTLYPSDNLLRVEKIEELPDPFTASRLTEA
jgi:hypothetical protein